MRIVVDRIEGKFAVLEVGDDMVNFPLSALPEGTAEGSVLTIALDSSDGAMAEAKARLERLKKRDPGGDVFEL